MHVIDYKSISPLWEVMHYNDDKKVFPLDTVRLLDAYSPDYLQDEALRDKIAFYAFYGVSTSLQPGTYKAEDLPDAVWQYKMRREDEWLNASQEAYDYAKTYERFKEIVEFFELLETRLYVPIPA